METKNLFQWIMGIFLGVVLFSQSQPVHASFSFQSTDACDQPGAKCLNVPYVDQVYSENIIYPQAQFTNGAGQRIWVWCGPSSVGMILDYYNKLNGSDPNAISTIASNIMTTNGGASDWYKFPSYLSNTYGISSIVRSRWDDINNDGKTEMNFDLVKAKIDAGIPIIVGLYYAPKDISHIFVITGYSTQGGNFVITNDPFTSGAWWQDGVSQFSPSTQNTFGYHQKQNYDTFADIWGNYLDIQTLPPTVSTDNAVFSAQSIYPTLAMGSNFQITFDLTNTGTTTWTPGSYWLQNTNSTALGASAQQPITSNVAPGQTYRWTINMTAPTTTGVYRTQWAPSHNGTIFGLVGVSMYIDVTVTTLPVKVNHDYNEDGKPDIYVISRENTGTHSTEIHVLNGADSYQTFLIHLGTAQPETGHESNMAFELADYNGDGKPDLYIIGREDTGTHSTEVHILNGADGYQTFLLRTGTPEPETGHEGNIVFGIADYNGDGKPDLYVISRESTGTHTTEVHILNGADGYQTFLTHLGTAQPETGHTGNMAFVLADYNGDGKPDLYIIGRENTGTHSTEIHILNGANGYQTWLLHTGTPLAETGQNGDVAFNLADYNGDSKPDLYIILRQGTGSHSTEVHILSGASSYQTFLLNGSTPLQETGSLCDFDFITGGNCINPSPTSTATNTATITGPTPASTNTVTLTPTSTATVTATRTVTKTPTPTITLVHATVTFTSASVQDGWGLESSETSGMGGTMNSSAVTIQIGDDATKKQYLGILSFATGAGLPDTAVITGVTLKIKKQGIVGGGNPMTIFQGLMTDLKNGTFGMAALQTSDFQAVASKSYGPFKPALVSDWYSIDLTNAGSYINRLATAGGLTQIRLRFKLDDNNNTVANYLSLYSGNAPVANRPQLIIKYYVP